MSRRDNVLAALLALSREGNALAGTPAVHGFTTEEIANRVGILRNNCSAELNMMVRDGILVKTAGRPARYRVSDALSSSAASPIVKPTFPAVSNSHNREVPILTEMERRIETFDWGVATQRSLREAVEQAKMALTYPPHGMHVLMLGETGVGKSTFSRKMHEYAKEYGVLHKTAPFVTFNCAEYASNPEILLSQLFGHTRGAFTGAHGDKPGLVEQAHNGVLFLDEVHRLPPQGQEMLFHLLDYGHYRRLGETQTWRAGRVLLVAATTELPESSLLSTFRRRIPVVIRLPALRDWSLYDRYELVYALCQEEALILGRPICLTAAALDKLLFSMYPANIGDLKNVLKLACARAYGGGAQATIRVLAEHVVTPEANAGHAALLSRFVQTVDLVVFPHQQNPPPLPILEEGSRYARLDRLSLTLQDLGFATDEIMGALERELRKQEQEAEDTPSTAAELRQFVGDAFYNAFARAWSGIQAELDHSDEESAFVRVAVHMAGVLRNHTSLRPPADSMGFTDLLERVKREYPGLYQLADRLLQRFQSESGTIMPSQEVPLVAMLLHRSGSDDRPRPGVVVALFGDGIANEIVAAARRLSRGTAIVAVNVPLQTPFPQIDDLLTKAVLQTHRGSGVLLLTDIPRFLKGGDWQAPQGIVIERIARPDLRTVVSAMKALEAPSASLEEVAKWLMGRTADARQVMPSRKRVVWACCLTGRGTARAMQRLIRDALPADLEGRVEIVSKELAHPEANLVPDEDLVAAVGSVNPNLFGIPFFSVESLLRRDGIEQLLNVIYFGDAAHLPETAEQPVLSDGASFSTPRGPSEASAGDDMEAYIRKLLSRDLVYVNPELAIQVAREMWDKILSGILSKQLALSQSSLKRETYVRFSLHMAYVIERLVRGEGMVHPYASRLSERYPVEWDVMKSAWDPVKDAFRIPVHVHELAYIFEIVFADREIEVFHG